MAGITPSRDQGVLLGGCQVQAALEAYTPSLPNSTMDTLVKALIEAVECKGQEMVARVRAEERVKTAEERVKTAEERVKTVQAEERVKTVQAEERVKTAEERVKTVQAEERVKTVQAEGKLVEAELRKAQTELLFLQGQLHMRGLMGKWLYGMGSLLQQ